MKIALVDDSVILRSALKNVLESSGFQVVLEAGSSQELFELLPKSKADLVLLDVFFPTENGLDILAKLKHLAPNTKVLLVTGMRQETIFQKRRLFSFCAVSELPDCKAKAFFYLRAAVFPSGSCRYCRFQEYRQTSSAEIPFRLRSFFTGLIMKHDDSPAGLPRRTEFYCSTN